ncbi:MAG: 2-hydroxyacid dehydrogenase [Paludibacteraceae bacterium]|jgi:D-lactate dehydrogenase|nr:2-hydroxyacid dehydrogenase [Paludibacteraceae bacterium]MBR6803813.1 2-hydroxyacid dehydrogenase [Paludibacteraceae bacterium]
MKIAVFSTQKYDREFLSAVPTEHKFVFFEAQLNTDTVNLTQGFDGVCIFVNDHADSEIISELKNNGIKVIALRCAGFNNVDVKAAEKAGIRVVRVPAYSPEAVAEHAVALIMTLNRKTHKAYLRIKENNFSLERLTGFNIYGKTVGVIGTGKIGKAFCKIMLGFGAKVIAYDKFEDDEAKKLGIKYVTFEEVLKNSDIISLHCPLTPETKYMIDWEAFANMKDGVMLINTSRGALINTKDAILALKRGKIGYLGIDVYEQEEHLFYKDLSENIIPDDTIARLMSFPNVMMTSHQGFFTKEALTEIAATTVGNIDCVAQGKPSPNEVKSE